MLQVTEHVRVLSKTEPQYTEDARRNQITGTVIFPVYRIIEPVNFFKFSSNFDRMPRVNLIVIRALKVLPAYQLGSRAPHSLLTLVCRRIEERLKPGRVVPDIAGTSAHFLVLSR